MEEWKQIENFPKYSCSNLGNIKNNEINRILLLTKKKSGYMGASLKDKNNKTKTIIVHQLIAQTWIPNPENKLTVNHINKIRSDNRIENLEWATSYEQSKHSLEFDLKNNIVRKKGTDNKGVWKCNSITKEKINYYKTLNDAANSIEGNKNYLKKIISECANGRRQSVGSYLWIFDNAYDNNNLDNEKWELIIKYNNNEYYISDYGRIRNKNRLLNPKSDEEGYLRVDIKDKKKRLHRLVAKKFVQNSNYYPTVNHINGNKIDNYYKNLEWVTSKMNSQHAIENGLKKNIKKVILYKENNNIINIFNSCVDASLKLNIAYSIILRCCKGTGRNYKNTNMKFKYLSSTDDLINKKIDIKTIPNKKSKDLLKKIIQYDDNFNIINIFKSITETSIKLNISVKTVKNYCNNKTKNEKIKLKYLSNTDDLANKKIDISTIIMKPINIKNNLRKEKVIQYDINNKIINIFESLTEAAKQLNISISTVKRCCYGKIKSCKNNTIRLKHLTKDDDLVNKKINSTIKYEKGMRIMKKIVEYKNDIIINIFDSIKDASQKLNINENSIRKFCGGKIGQFKDKDIKLKYLSLTDDLLNKKIDISTIPYHNTKIKTPKKVINIAIYDKSNNNLIEILDDPKEISKKYNLSYKSIIKHCKGEIKYSKNKYTFKFAQ